MRGAAIFAVFWSIASVVALVLASIRSATGAVIASVTLVWLGGVLVALAVVFRESRRAGYSFARSIGHTLRVFLAALREFLLP